MQKLFNMSIWAKDAIPADEWKYRNLKRVMFPIIDFVFFLGGISAAYYGVPAISEFFNRFVVDSYSTLFSLTGLMCLIGVAFPRLWPIEICARSILLGLLMGYFVSLFLLTAVGQGNRGFVLTFAAVAIVLTAWRINLIGAEWQERKVLAKGDADG